MKVKELIQQLQSLDPELEVVTKDPGCGCCSDGVDTIETIELVNPEKTWDDRPIGPAVKLNW